MCLIFITFKNINLYSYHKIYKHHICKHLYRSTNHSREMYLKSIKFSVPIVVEWLFKIFFHFVFSNCFAFCFIDTTAPRWQEAEWGVGGDMRQRARSDSNPSPLHWRQGLWCHKLLLCNCFMNVVVQSFYEVPRFLWRPTLSWMHRSLRTS